MFNHGPYTEFLTVPRALIHYSALRGEENGRGLALRYGILRRSRPSAAPRP
jgi:hypothetical protein